jgi:hypothetical protein
VTSESLKNYLIREKSRMPTNKETLLERLSGINPSIISSNEPGSLDDQLPPDPFNDQPPPDPFNDQPPPDPFNDQPPPDPFNDQPPPDPFSDQPPMGG